MVQKFCSYGGVEKKKRTAILHIAEANEFPLSLLTKLNTHIRHKLSVPHTINDHTTTTSHVSLFTFHSSLIRKITNFFHNTNLGIAFQTNNTIHNILDTRTDIADTRAHSGIYQTKCHSCHIGQTGRRLESRYKEHVRCISANNPQSLYAKHILSSMHKYRPIEKTMALLQAA